MGRSNRTELGQFFTPQEVADFIIDFALTILKRKPTLAIDPSCGEGAFLRGLIKKSIELPVGIDVDERILERIPEEVRERSKIFIADSLLSLAGLEGKADLVVGNPPFSAKHRRIKNAEILSKFELGRGRKSQAVEILFLEKFIKLAKESGVIGIILPSSIFSCPSLDYVKKFLLENVAVLAVVSLPRHIFKGTTAKTSVLFARKGKEKEEKIFMGIVEEIDELPLVVESYRNKKELERPTTFWTSRAGSLSPEYNLFLRRFAGGVRLGELVSEIFCGRTVYGVKRKFTKDGVRYISAKVVTPLGLDFERDKRFVDKNSDMYNPKSHVRVGDLLFVRVGAGCLGRAAVVTNENEAGVVDDWIYVIRPKRSDIAYYLAFFIQSKTGKAQIDLLKTGVGTTTISQHNIKELRVVIPRDDELVLFKNFYIRMVEARGRGDMETANLLYKTAVELVEDITRSALEISQDSTQNY